MIALLAVQLVFALFPVIGKQAFDVFSPGAVAAWRIGAGAVVLGIIALLSYGADAVPPRAALPRLALCAFLGVVLNQGLFLEGLARTKVLNTGLIMCVIPVATYGIAVLLRQEANDRRRVLGIVIACLGTVPLLIEDGGSIFEGGSLGVVLVITNGLCYSAYLVLSKPLLKAMPPVVVIAWVYLLSTFALPWFARGNELFPPLAGNEAGWIRLAFIVAFPTVLAYLWNVYALKRVRASTVAFFVFLQPMITGAAGVMVLGEELLTTTWVAAAALFVAVWLVVKSRGPRPPARAEAP